MAKLVNDALDAVEKKDYKSYILLVFQGVSTPCLKRINKSEYQIGYNIDRFEDETRQKFYKKYLNKNYKKDGFGYHGDDGFVDLNTELMIYSHVWESFYCLRILIQIARILDGKGYEWNFKLGKIVSNEIKTRIITPLKKNQSDLASTIENLYNDDLRNAFAHSHYWIDEETQNIHLSGHLYSLKAESKRVFTFSEFQLLFLQSIYLNYFLSYFISQRKCKLAETNDYVITHEDPIILPDKKKMAIHAGLIQWNDILVPDIQGQIVK